MPSNIKIPKFNGPKIGHSIQGMPISTTSTSADEYSDTFVSDGNYTNRGTYVAIDHPSSLGDTTTTMPTVSDHWIAQTQVAPAQAKRKTKRKRPKTYQAYAGQHSYRKESLNMSKEDAKQNSQDILEALEISPIPGRTYLHAVAIATGKDEAYPTGNNRQRPVASRHGTAFASGYPYDQGQDAYMIHCVESVDLGHVSCMFEAKMEDTGWVSSVPLPPAVLDRLLTGTQKKKLIAFRTKYPAPGHEIKLVQMAGCEY